MLATVRLRQEEWERQVSLNHMPHEKGPNSIGGERLENSR